MKQQAKKWQAEALTALFQEYTKGHRAALLQLPPGQGKTLVAVRYFKRLSKHGYRLVVASPTRDLRYFSVWTDQFNRDLGEAFPWFTTKEAVHSDTAHAAVISHHELKEALDGRGPLVVAEWFRKKRRVVVVVDELHRASSLKKCLADAFWGGIDDKLPRRLRGPTGHLRWLLLSATPYNPVRLDYDMDKPDHDFQGDVEAINLEADQVADEVELTLGALAQLSGHPKETSGVKLYTDEIRAVMASDNGNQNVPKPPVAIVPRNSITLRPAPPNECHVKAQHANIEDSVLSLANIHHLLSCQPKLSDRIAIAERLVLGGVTQYQSRIKNKKLCGHKYSDATVRATVIAASVMPSGNFTAKIAALEVLVRGLLKQKKKVLIFCVHRAVATAVTKHLRKALLLSGSEVVDATQYFGGKLDEKCKLFRSNGESPYVLVATDKLSESINLHQACNCLIHFELPWSPLRVLQRVGRLWRIRSKEQKKPSRAPIVYHVIHPCSVEEEILNRLYRRWDYLGILGLDYMPIEYGLGRRIPNVPWTTQA